MNHIIGNKTKIRELLNKDIKKIMISGPKGVGKFTVATNKAKLLLCFSESHEDCKCESCRRFDANCHPDIVVISLEGTLKKEVINELIKYNFERPTLSNVRVIIIDNADQMTTAAQNALLKTLEDAALYNHFILINHRDVLSTIRSRVCEIKFSRILEEDFESALLSRYSKSDTFDKQVLYLCTQGAIGRAFEFIESGKYEIFRETMMKFIENYASKERNVFEVFLLVKEKAEDNFFESIKGYWKEFIIILYAIFIDFNLTKNFDMDLHISYCKKYSVSIPDDHYREILNEIQSMLKFEKTLSVNSFFQLAHKLDYL